jgi:hypothetical protein
VWIDALFGIGQSRPPGETLETLLEQRQRMQPGQLIAIDGPTGICADSGKLLGRVAACAAVSLSIGLLKQGFLQDQALAWVGQLERIELGLPAQLLQGLGPNQPLALLGRDLATAPWPQQPEAASKYQRGRLLVIAGTDFAKAPESIRLPIAGVIAREQTHWQGDWATSFSWLKKQGPFAHLPGNPLLEMEYASVMPDAIIVGTPTWAYGDRSWAGLALGWIHKPVSLLLKAPYGDGQITVTTFKLSAAAVREDAMAQALMVGVVNLAAAE